LLGSIPGGVSSAAGGINNSGQVCGAGLVELRPGVVGFQSFVWKQGTFTLLGTLPGYEGNTARDINDLGQIVGQLNALGPPAETRAFLWQLDEIYDLNDLLAMKETITLWRAHAINNHGQIIADGIDTATGDAVSFLLTPIGLTGDLDGDCSVGIDDFLGMLLAWGPCPGACPPSCVADLDGDCDVGIVDFLTLLANWG